MWELQPPLGCACPLGAPTLPAALQAPGLDWATNGNPWAGRADTKIQQTPKSFLPVALPQPWPALLPPCPWAQWPGQDTRAPGPRPQSLTCGSSGWSRSAGGSPLRDPSDMSGTSHGGSSCTSGCGASRVGLREEREDGAVGSVGTCGSGHQRSARAAGPIPALPPPACCATHCLCPCSRLGQWPPLQSAPCPIQGPKAPQDPAL